MCEGHNLHCRMVHFKLLDRLIRGNICSNLCNPIGHQTKDLHSQQRLGKNPMYYYKLSGSKFRAFKD